MTTVAGVSRVAVVGAGVIGASWTALLLARGMDVTVTDPNPDAEADLHRFVASAWADLSVLGLAPDASPSRLCFTADLEEACRDADFVQENASENEQVKVALMARIDAALQPCAVIASSSSAFTVTAMQRACLHPERVVLGHPFNPPHLVPLVEIAGGERTSGEALDRAEAFYASLGKTPVRLRKEIYGHIANRLQAAVFREALNLLIEGVADVSEIDKAMTDGPGLRWALMGPFQTFHLAGGPGGMTHFMRHLAGMQGRIMSDLGTPDLLDPAVQKQVIQLTNVSLGQRLVSDLAAERDRGLLAVLRARPPCGRSA